MSARTTIGRVLVVDDEPPQREILQAILRSAGWEVSLASGAREALARLEETAPDVVLSDLRMAGQDGLDLLASIRGQSPEIPTVLMTGHGTVETAVRAMKEGAFDYLTKPLSRDELLLTLGRAMERVRLLRQNQALREALEERYSADNLIAQHGLMQAVLRLVSKVAPTSSTVLLCGETGTGKELIARAIHAKSQRKDGPFVPLNCAAIPEQLLESELFGYEKGAFTGAQGRKIGLFERAGGGTLFLDEIGDLPLSLQPKLLRAIQEKEIMRLGGEAPVPVDVRVVSATHRDLAKMVAEGSFREDLYWRLNVFPIQLPPLRERTTDIPILAERFLAKVAAESHHPPRRLSEEALKALERYPWPGNVRQLQSVVERASLLAEGPEITPADLPAELSSPAKPTLRKASDVELPEEGFVFEDFERDLLRLAMERSNGVIARAAKMLGMSYRTLQYRLDKFGLRPHGENTEGGE